MQKQKYTETAAENLALAGINALQNQGFCILDKKGFIHFSNPAATRICGYELNTLLGKNVSVLFPNSHAQKILSDAENQHIVQHECWLIRADGSLLWAKISITSFKEEDFSGFSFWFADYTKEHQKEILHLETEQRFKHVIDGIQAGIWDWDVKNNICYWNDKFIEIFGIDNKKRRCFETALEQIHPEDQKKVKETMKNHVLFNKKYEVEYRIIKPSGEICYCLSRGNSIRDKQGLAIRVTGAVLDITEQKITESQIQALHFQLKKRFSATFEQAAVGFAHVGLNSIWQHVNAKLCEIFGYPEKELTTLTYQEITYPEDLPADLENVRKILAGEISTYSMEKRFIRKDKSLVWANLTVSLVRDNQNNPEYFISVIEDISERKKAEFQLQETFQKLRDNESRLKCIIDSNNVGIVFFDTNHSLLDANASFLKMVGYTKKDVLANNITWGKITSSKFHEADKIMFSELIKKGFYQNHEKELIRKDGKKIYTLLNMTVINREKIEIVGFVLDITQRKLTEQALLESEKRFRKMSEEAPIMLWMTDEKGKTAYANQYWLNYVGLSLEEYVGHFRPETGVIHPDEEQKVRAEFIKAVKKQTKFHQKIRYKRYDGEYRWLSLSANPRFTPSGQFLGHIGICQDITEKKLAKDNLKKFNQELEKRVEQRTAEIKAINKELEAFSYTVSHDLRAPLRSIDGFSRIIINRYQHYFPEDAKQYFNYIIDNTDKMGKLIDDLLQLSRISRVEMELEDVNLSNIAEEIIFSFFIDAPKNDAKFSIQPNIIAKADKRLIRIVLDNLLNNAYKFSSKVKNPFIEFTVQKENDQDIYVIRDNGAGFNMKFYDKLFTAFQRLHSLNEFAGTGVGLATVQRIIHRHKGQVWAESEIDKGASFFFTLPLQIE